MISASLHPETVRAACQPRGRFAFGLTPRAIWLLVAGLVLALPGFFSARLGYGMLVWDALVLIAVLGDGLRLPAPQSITVERSWSNAPSLSSATEIEIAVEQNGGTILECRIVDDLPEALVGVPATQSLRVWPRVRAALRYKIEPRDRGDVTTGAVYLRYRSLLGLIEKWAMAPLQQTVRVYPALRQGEDQEIFLARGRQIDLQLRQVRERGLGRDFESLREYLEGDDLRDICWTATARRGQLITRRYQTERSQAVWIVLDAGRLLQGRILRDTDDRGAARPLQARLCVLDRGGSGATGALLRRSRGPARLRPACAAARASRPRPGALAADCRGAGAGARRNQRSRSPARHGHLEPLAAAARADLVDHRPGGNRHAPGGDRRRHATACAGMCCCLWPWRSLTWKPLPKARPKNVEQMFRAAAAQELAMRRELLLARLREQGALTLDLDPDQLTSAVLNQYLKVKERAMV